MYSVLSKYFSFYFFYFVARSLKQEQLQENIYERLFSIPVLAKHTLKHVFLLEEAKPRDASARSGGMRMYHNRVFCLQEPTAL